MVGVLALQGDFAAHRQALHRLGMPTKEVRRPAELEGLGGLVLPGGESTTLLKLLGAVGMLEAITSFVRSGGAVLATCAGLILLAEEVTNPSQPSLGLLRASVQRNAYGRQLASTVAELSVTDPQELPTPRLEGVFIRAPRVVRVGEGVKVLACRDQDPVLLRQGRILAATFHPELSDNSPVIALFAALVGGDA